MAGIEDALRFLDPKYIDKAKELLSDPMGSGAGIMEPIKDLCFNSNFKIIFIIIFC